MSVNPEHNHPSDDESDIDASAVEIPDGLNLQSAPPLTPTSDDSFLAFVSTLHDETINPKEFRGSDFFVYDPSLAIFVVDESIVQKSFALVQVWFGIGYRIIRTILFGYCIRKGYFGIGLGYFCFFRIYFGFG
jgi:hypothetical protein